MRLYTWRRAGLADEVGSDAMPDAAGGEGGHRYIFVSSSSHFLIALRHEFRDSNTRSGT